MRELAMAYLAQTHPTPWNWAADETARALFEFLYDGGLGIEDYRACLREIKGKRLEGLTLKETEAYLTMLAQHDRVSDCYASAIEKGTLAALLQHYLDLTETG